MSVSEFLSMKGYGLYVWGSYGVAFAIFLLEIVLVRRKRQATLEQLRLMRDMEGEE